MHLQVNTIYHNLNLLKHCGGGAFGEVYYCRDISGRHLAVKIIPKARLGDAWERELRGVTNYRSITANSPDLLQIFHVGEDEESFFYTMEAADSLSDSEYIPDTLSARLTNGALPPETLLPVLRDILDGIKVIHEAGFAHRDIKPDNIIFVKGKPKLGDIGLISSLAATMTQMAGTLDFLPPEQRAAESSDSTDRASRQRSDLYAFGKVIYCSATGQSPHDWPTIPGSITLSLPLKFFIRLSFRLCDREPMKRLDAMSQLECEFVEIERKLLFGETTKDKIRHIVKTAAINLGSNFFLLFRWGCRHWIALLIFLLFSGCATWHWWPESPFDITKQQTKQYANSDLKLTMTIPFQWEIMSADFMRGMVDDEDVAQTLIARYGEKFFENMKISTKEGMDSIYCDYDLSFSDNLTIKSVMASRDDFDVPDEELRLLLRGLFEGQFGLNTKIYEVKRMKINDIPCVFIDFSCDPDTIRIHHYIFLLDKNSFFIVLTAKNSTFKKRMEQFESILTTLKIGK